MRRLSTLTTLAAAVLVAVAATLAFPVAPAQAAYCSGGTGVSVLVDFGALGGGTATGCGGSASVASDAFSKAGFHLATVPQQPGAVCQVQGKPNDGKCWGKDSYWGFFVSDDGKGWVYASMGVYQQAVDSGDSVALVWQSTSSQRKPGTAPPPSAGGDESVPSSGKTTKRPRPKPTKEPVKPTPTAAATTAPATEESASSPTSTPTASATRTASKRPAPTRQATTSATPTPTQAVTPTESATPSPSTTAATEPTSSDDGGGLPGWVAPGLVALLAIAAGGVAWARRAR